MPWATEAKVREIGGLNNTDAVTGDFKIFKFTTNAQLTTAIENAIAVASAFLQLRIISGYYATTDPNLQVVLAQAESYIALHYLLPAVKARKVEGIFYPVESEEAESYKELIDIEWMELAEELLIGLVQFDIGGSKNFSRPTLRTGRVIDPFAAGFKTEEQIITETLDRARSLGILQA